MEKAVFVRRLKTIPTIFLAWAISLPLSPLLVVAAIGVDVARLVTGNSTFSTLRLFFFGVAYLTAEVVGVSMAGMQWLATGFGANHERLMSWSYRLQGRWTAFLLASIKKAFSLNVEAMGLEHTVPGPYILMMRHASMIDVLLPASLIAHQKGIKLRWILKQELLSDPALDVVGSRLPNHFVDRSGRDAAAEREAIRQLGVALQHDEAVMIYPEGTRFSTKKRDVMVRKMSRIYPDFAAEFESLDSVLPPQPGGSLALLDFGYDIVFGTHSGLAGLASLRQIWSGALVGTTIRAEFWRVEAPKGSVESRLPWLLKQWQEVDRRTRRLEDRRQD